MLNQLNPFSEVKSPSKVLERKGTVRFGLTKESKTAIKQAASIMMFGPVIGMWFATNTSYGPSASKKTSATRRTSSSSRSSTSAKKPSQQQKKPLTDDAKKKQEEARRKAAAAAAAARAEKKEASNLVLEEVKPQKAPKKPASAPKASGTSGGAEKPFKLATASQEEISARLLGQTMSDWCNRVGGVTDSDSTSLFLASELANNRSNDYLVRQLAESIGSISKTANSGDFEQVASNWLESTQELVQYDEKHTPDQLNMGLLTETLRDALAESLLND